MKNIYIFLLVSFFVFGCKNNEVIEKEKFADIYIDVLIAQETFKQDLAKADSVKESIFAKHNIDVDKYNATLESYGTDQKEWDEFFILVNSKINYLQNELKEKNRKQKDSLEAIN